MQTRRQFLARSGATAAAVVLAPQEAALAQRERGAPGRRRRRRSEPLPRNMLRGGRFSQGVLSGDPQPSAITLMTLVDEVGGAGQVRLEVARDPNFRRVVATRDILTTQAINHSVKARVTGLRPYTRYWYRFETRDRNSPVGRFQTALPPDSRQPVRFAFFSCANFTDGWFNAYAAIEREDVDFVVCLGDYIYSEVTREGVDAVRDDPIGAPNRYYPRTVREAATLPEYRAKYALYRSDSALRKMHARFPMIAVWDDHELQNNYANGADDGGLPLRRRYSRARRDAAYQAYFESMPVFPQGRSQIYRALRYGRTVEMVMLDERQYRDDQPCSDALAFPCGNWQNSRTMLGARQLKFLKSRIAASPAAWKVIGNQTLIMPNRIHDGQYQRFDSWQGYMSEREDLLAYMGANQIKDVVFVTGDTHVILAGDVRTQMGAGESVAVEFASGSISSATVGQTNYRMPGGQLIPGAPDPTAPPEVIAHYRALNPWYDAIDLDHHGYGVVRATQRDFDVTLKRIETASVRGNGKLLPPSGFRWRLGRGQTSIAGTAIA